LKRNKSLSNLSYFFLYQPGRIVELEWKISQLFNDLLSLFVNILQQPLSTEDSEAVNHSLLLIRNILHAPERPPCPSKMSTGSNNEDKGQQQPAAAGSSQTPYLGPHSHSHGFTADCSQQNRLLWNLFAQGLDRLLINLLASSQKVSIELPINFLVKKKEDV